MEINTKDYAELWEKELIEKISHLDTIPNLLIIIAKDYYKPSSIYVNNKLKVGSKLGVNVSLIEIEDWENKNKEYLANELKEIISNHKGYSVICQLPFPKLSQDEIAEMIPGKFDVDGFTLYQKGKLVNGEKDALIPCTALGVFKLLKYLYKDLNGKSIAIVNRSNLIGKPLIQLSIQNNMTPTVIHTKTTASDKERVLNNSNIVITGCGQRKLFNHKDFNPEYTETIIDCSMDKVEGIKNVGDCDKEDIIENYPNIQIASGYNHTGLLTVLGLYENVLKAHIQHSKLKY